MIKAHHRGAAIRVEGVGKRYQIGSAPTASYRTLRESIGDAIGSGLRRLQRRRSEAARSGDTVKASRPSGHFWALRDVNFQVQPGEVIGIIGRNGAGKSTLLKVLSRIAEPTLGRVEVRGRMGSLLEVGTGFHPELTGRENIYLNGAILGMSRGEITRKFDQIVDFAEVEEFLDTPVKRYSSGMYVRLAFAVAANLEPEILIVDEVLAVGDAQFQRKCIGKISDVGRSGRTVLFVSHNLNVVRSLCTRCILISRGRVVRDGNAEDVVNEYLTPASSVEHVEAIPERMPRMTNGDAIFRTVRFTDTSDVTTSAIHFGQRFRVHATCEVFREVLEGHFEVSVSTADGTHVLYATTIDGGRPPVNLAKGMHSIVVEFESTLLPNHYMIDLGVHMHSGTTVDFVQRTCAFEVLRVSSVRDDHYRWIRVRGLVRPATRWTVSQEGAAEVGVPDYVDGEEITR